MFMLLVKTMAAFLTSPSCVTDTPKVKCVNSCQTLVDTITDMIFAYLKAFFIKKKKVIKVQV